MSCGHSTAGPGGLGSHLNFFLWVSRHADEDGHATEDERGYCSPAPPRPAPPRPAPPRPAPPRPITFRPGLASTAVDDWPGN